jgi:hypothetical protein
MTETAERGVSHHLGHSLACFYPFLIEKDFHWSHVSGDVFFDGMRDTFWEVIVGHPVSAKSKKTIAVYRRCLGGEWDKSAFIKYKGSRWQPEEPIISSSINENNEKRTSRRGGNCHIGSAVARLSSMITSVISGACDTVTRSSWYTDSGEPVIHTKPLLGDDDDDDDDEEGGEEMVCGEFKKEEEEDTSDLPRAFDMARPVVGDTEIIYETIGVMTWYIKDLKESEYVVRRMARNHKEAQVQSMTSFMCENGIEPSADRHRSRRLAKSALANSTRSREQGKRDENSALQELAALNSEAK